MLSLETSFCFSDTALPYRALRNLLGLTGCIPDSSQQRALLTIVFPGLKRSVRAGHLKLLQFQRRGTNYRLAVSTLPGRSARDLSLLSTSQRQSDESAKFRGCYTRAQDPVSLKDKMEYLRMAFITPKLSYSIMNYNLQAIFLLLDRSS